MDLTPDEDPFADEVTKFLYRGQTSVGDETFYFFDLRRQPLPPEAYDDFIAYCIREGITHDNTPPADVAKRLADKFGAGPQGLAGLRETKAK